MKFDPRGHLFDGFTRATLKWVYQRGPIPWNGWEMTNSHRDVLRRAAKQELVVIDYHDGELEVRAPGERLPRLLNVLSALPMRAIYLVRTERERAECRAFMRRKGLVCIHVMLGNADSPSTVWRYTHDPRVRRPIYLSPSFQQSGANSLTLREHNARFGLDHELPDFDGEPLPEDERPGALPLWPPRPLWLLEQAIAAMAAR